MLHNSLEKVNCIKNLVAIFNGQILSFQLTSSNDFGCSLVQLISNIFRLIDSFFRT